MKIKNNLPPRVYFLRKDMRESTQTNTFRQLFFYDGRLSENSGGSPTGLLSFSEITIAPNAHFDFQTPANLRLVILPLVGEVELLSFDNQISLLTTGEYHSFMVGEGKDVQLKNTNHSENSSLITIQIATNEASVSASGRFEFSENVLQKLIFSDDEPFNVHIGSFGNRTEAMLEFKKNTTAFCFVINGIIEIENRLTEAGDSLYLFNCSKIELESLTKNGIILVLEERVG